MQVSTKDLDMKSCLTLSGRIGKAVASCTGFTGVESRPRHPVCGSHLHFASGAQGVLPCKENNRSSVNNVLVTTWQYLKNIDVCCKFSMERFIML